ncbi:cyclin p1 [Pelomyxa schiedti]|nr:cyclin p1 [Pelomyxa schiedti]
MQAVKQRQEVRHGVMLVEATRSRSCCSGCCATTTTRTGDCCGNVILADKNETVLSSKFCDHPQQESRGTSLSVPVAMMLANLIAWQSGLIGATDGSNKTSGDVVSYHDGASGDSALRPDLSFESSLHRAPSISLQSYIQRIEQHIGYNVGAIVCALVYIDRLLTLNKSFCITYFNVHRLFITCIVLANKYLEDRVFNNVFYSKVGGISLTDLNRMEKTLLNLLKFDLYVDVQQYSRYLALVTSCSSSVESNVKMIAPHNTISPLQTCSAPSGTTNPASLQGGSTNTSKSTLVNALPYPSSYSTPAFAPKPGLSYFHATPAQQIPTNTTAVTTYSNNKQHIHQRCGTNAAMMYPNTRREYCYTNNLPQCTN